MIQALIFDFDGLILDTETPDYLSWRETYASFGVDLPLDAWRENIGSTGLFDPYLYLEARLGRPIDRTAVHARRKQRDNELLAAQTILPGVAAYLADARQLGLKIGLASSSGSRVVLNPSPSEVAMTYSFSRVGRTRIQSCRSNGCADICIVP